MPARRAFIAAVLISLLLVVGIVEPGVTEVALAIDALLVAMIVIDLVLAARTPLSAQRTTPPVMAQGTDAPFVVLLTNHSRRTVALVAREALHPFVAESPLRQRLTIPADKRARWSYSVRPRRRGEPVLGPLTVRVLGPWGLAWHQRDLLPAQARRVYPQTRWEGRVGKLLALAHRHELGQSPMQTRGSGLETYALREYLPGDPLSRVHWRASARHARLITREETWERGRPLVILLDCARSMVSLDGERSKLDHALAASLALVRVAVGRGDRVTIVAFSDRVERLVRVHAGPHGLSRAYGALFDLPARLTEPAYDVAHEALARTEGRHSTVVLFTSVTDLATAELLRQTVVGMRRRHRVILMNLEDPELSALALGTPEAVDEAFAKTATLEVLLANRRLGKQLRRMGISVVASPADRLTWSGLEAYLRLAGSGRRQQARVDAVRSTAATAVGGARSPQTLRRNEAAHKARSMPS